MVPGDGAVAQCRGKVSVVGGGDGVGGDDDVLVVSVNDGNERMRIWQTT